MELSTENEGAEIEAAATADASPPDGTRDRRNDFIFNLLRLASPDNPKQTDRQALAEMRGVLRGTPADYYRAARHVTPFLGEREGRNDHWFYLVGGLLALHPQHKQGVSLGTAFRALRDDSGSIDARFLSLLNTRADALPRVLRQMVSLLEARGVALDYMRLLRELCSWDDPRHWVQKQWARDYFRTEKTASADTSTTKESNSNED